MRKTVMILGFLLVFVFTLPALAQGVPAAVTEPGDSVTLQQGVQQVTVRLIRMDASIGPINVTLYDMGAGLLGIETLDPAGVALPNVHITPATTTGMQDAVMIQTHTAENYRFRQIGTANVLPFIRDAIGSTTAGELHTLLTQSYNGPLNLLLPAGPAADPMTPLVAYRTPLAHTVVVIPAEFVAGGVLPVGALDLTETLVMHVANLNVSPYALLDLNAQVTVPDFSALPRDLAEGNVHRALELATATMPFGFRYNIFEQSCTDSQSTVLAQFPSPGAPIRVFDGAIELTVCSGVGGRVATNGTSLNLRLGAGLNVGNIFDSIPNGTALTAIGRSTDNVWLRVRVDDGREGWVSRDFVQLDAPLEAVPVLNVPIVNFTADDYTLAPFQCVNVSWRVLNASQVLYRNTVVAASGGVLECPTSAVTYTLTVTGSNGQTITVPLSLVIYTSGY